MGVLGPNLLGYDGTYYYPLVCKPTHNKEWTIKRMEEEYGIKIVKRKKIPKIVPKPSEIDIRTSHIKWQQNKVLNEHTDTTHFLIQHRD